MTDTGVPTSRGSRRTIRSLRPAHDPTPPPLDGPGFVPRSTPPVGDEDAPRSAFPDPPPTSEVDWACLVARAPELPLSARPVVVVAPHPDDESLAVGGMLAELRAHDVAVEVLAVTDGEASHPDLSNLGALRAVEQRRALMALGIDDPPVRLGLPDGGVGEDAATLTAALEERCGPETVILAPWLHDGHPDHDACGEVAIDVARRTGAAVWAYPVWAWRWAVLSDLERLALRRVTLRPEVRQAKEAAIACHHSQTTHLDGPPILDEEVLTHFARPWDVIIDARDLLED